MSPCGLRKSSLIIFHHLHHPHRLLNRVGVGAHRVDTRLQPDRLINRSVVVTRSLFETARRDNWVGGVLGFLSGYGFFSRTPIPSPSVAKRNRIPPASRAFFTLNTVETRASPFSCSSRATAFRLTKALSASCCCVHPSSDRAARICEAATKASASDANDYALQKELLQRIKRLFLLICAP